ncbi:MAG: preprotein translocase subunit YajC [Deltaproteobacteria bacterium]|nr:preprotein translocase subunit YajC [Deltaproteobacteria bacterium]MBW2392892.1 preprotein translocase subunit YajC [Deltaproteobacteria bacterium]
MADGSWILLQAPSGGSALEFLFPMAMIFLIFYFLLIRPQQKKQKDHDEMLNAVQKGDRVVTTGGLHGEVVGSSEDVLTLDVGTQKGQVKVKIDRNRIERKIEKKGASE